MRLRHGLTALLALALVAGGAAACGGDSGRRGTGREGTSSRSGCASPPARTTEKTAKDLAAEVHRRQRRPGQGDRPVRRLRDQAAAGRRAEGAARHRHQRHRPARHPGQAGPRARGRPGRHGRRRRPHPGAWEAAKGADGKYYAVPFSAQSFALFIRKDWREKLGAARPRRPGPSWTRSPRRSPPKDPDGNGKADTYGFVVPGSTKRGYASWYFSSFLWSAGGDFFTGHGRQVHPRDRTPRSRSRRCNWFKEQFCTDKTVRAGRGDHGDHPGAPGVRDRQGRHLLHRAVQHGAASTRASARTSTRSSRCPAGPGGKASSLAEGENVYLMAGSENQAGQKKFAEFAVSAEGQKIGMAGDTDGTIVRLPVNNKVELAAVRKDTRWAGLRRRSTRRPAGTPRPCRTGPRSGRPPPTRSTRSSPTAAPTPRPSWTSWPRRSGRAEQAEPSSRRGLTQATEVKGADVPSARRPPAPPAPATGAPASRARHVGAPWLFLAPALILFALFKFVPMVRADRDELPRGPAVPGRPVGRRRQLPAGRHRRRRSARPSGTRSSSRVGQTVGSIAARPGAGAAARGQARHLWFVRTAVFLPAVAAMAVVAEVWRIIYYPAPDGMRQLGPRAGRHGPVAVPQLRRHLAVVGDGGRASGAAPRTT